MCNGTHLGPFVGDLSIYGIRLGRWLEHVPVMWTSVQYLYSIIWKSGMFLGDCSKVTMEVASSFGNWYLRQCVKNHVENCLVPRMSLCC